MHTSNASPGRQVETRFDVILADVVPGSAVTWNLAASSVAQTSLEVYSATNPALPQLIDRFDASGPSGQFRSDGSRLASDRTVSVSSIAPPLVLAHYYPWYPLASWESAELADRPAQLY